MLKCPICDFENNLPSQINKHFLQNLDTKHLDFMQSVAKKYTDGKMSPAMIKKELDVHLNTIDFILEYLKIRIRTHVEAVALAVSQNRQNINAYGNGRFREDLNGYYRSSPEANFARILRYKKIDFKHEVEFRLYDENSNYIATYFLDFLINENQGIEVKGYQKKNGDFKNRKKIILFTKQYPEIKLKVLFCDSKEWKELKETYVPLIPAWETNKDSNNKKSKK